MRNKSFQKLQQKNTNPTINQYLNRLREFFEVDILDQAEDEFLTLVDFGLSPNSAFESTIGYK